MCSFVRIKNRIVNVARISFAQYLHGAVHVWIGDDEDQVIFNCEEGKALWSYLETIAPDVMDSESVPALSTSESEVA